MLVSSLGRILSSQLLVKRSSDPNILCSYKNRHQNWETIIGKKYSSKTYYTWKEELTSSNSTLTSFTMAYLKLQCLVCNENYEVQNTLYSHNEHFDASQLRQTFLSSTPNLSGLNFTSATLILCQYKILDLKKPEHLRGKRGCKSMQVT